MEGVGVEDKTSTSMAIGAGTNCMLCPPSCLFQIAHSFKLIFKFPELCTCLEGRGEEIGTGCEGRVREFVFLEARGRGEVVSGGEGANGVGVMNVYVSIARACHRPRTRRLTDTVIRARYPYRIDPGLDQDGTVYGTGVPV